MRSHQPHARARAHCQQHARARAASSASRGSRRCCGVATEGIPCGGWPRHMVVLQRVEQKLSMISSMTLRTLSTATILQAKNHSRVYLLIISLYHQTIMQQEKIPRNLLWVPAQQEMCDKTEHCMLGLLCTKLSSPKWLAEYGCTCSCSCVSWYVSSALCMP